MPDGTYGAVAAPDCALHWYAIRVKANLEKPVLSALEAKAYETFLPLCPVRKQWSDRIKELRQPLFLGYLFARFDARVRLPILKTPGVLSILGFGNEPIAIPDAEIEAVRRLASSNQSILHCPFVQVGQRVRIEGLTSLDGLEGILVELKKQLRVVVSVTLLQRSVAVEIDRHYIRPVSIFRKTAEPYRSVASAQSA